MWKNKIYEKYHDRQWPAIKEPLKFMKLESSDDVFQIFIIKRVNVNLKKI